MSETSRDPNGHAQTWINKAIAAINAGDTLKGITYSTRAAALEYDDPQLWFRNGLLFFTLNRYDEALRCYDQALRINFQFGKVWFNKGLLLCIRKQFREALQCFDSAMALLPADTEPIYHKGQALKNLGEFQKAIECYEQVLALNDAHATAWGSKGDALAALGNEAEALDCYSRYTSLEGSDAGGWYNRGVSLQALERTSDALLSYDRSLSLDPNHALALGNKGVLLRDQGRYRAALACFERAVRFGNLQATNGIASCKQRIATEEDLARKVPQGEFKRGEIIETHLVVHDMKQGGMGNVYMCYDNTMKRPVAVKTFRQEFISKPRDRLRFLEEGRTWARLTKHPNAVECYYTFQKNGRPYLVIEYVEGDKDLGASLRDWINRGRLQAALAVRLCLQVCAAMQHAQDILPGFVHCDLKPENLLVTKDHDIKVTDFGLAKVLDSTVSLGRRAGTAPYMSPEQVQCHDLDQRSDIYALGCILYEIIVGHFVFAASSDEEFMRCHAEIQPEPLSPSASLSPQLNTVVMQCLEKNPHRRPPTFAALANMLEGIYAQFTGRKLSSTDEASTAMYDARNKSLALHNLGFNKEALDMLSQAMKRSNVPGDWLVRGNMLFELQRYQDALDAYNKFLDCNPEQKLKAVGWMSRGNCLSALGMPEEALESYDKALAIDPKSYDTWLNRAETLKRLGRLSEAERPIDDYLRIDPEDRCFLYAKASILQDRQQYAEAIDYCNQALAVDPMFLKALNSKGVALMSLERWEEALSCFDRLVEMNKSHALGWCNRGHALVSAGKLREALASFDQTLAIDPTYPNVTRLREEIVQALRKR